MINQIKHYNVLNILCIIENNEYSYNLPKRRYKVWHIALGHPVISIYVCIYKIKNILFCKNLFQKNHVCCNTNIKSWLMKKIEFRTQKFEVFRSLKLRSVNFWNLNVLFTLEDSLKPLRNNQKFFKGCMNRIIIYRIR